MQSITKKVVLFMDSLIRIMFVFDEAKVGLLGDRNVSLRLIARVISLKFLCFCVFGWLAAISFIETFAEIAAAAEACEFGNFRDGPGAFLDEPGGVFEAYFSNKECGCLVEDAFQLLVQSGTLHAQIFGELFHIVSVHP